MLRIRLHGRGGQGVKTAGRILGSALFRAGFYVQDAPRYGAERRGAPIFAYVRADTRPILERGVMRAPDLAVVIDDSLMQVAAAGVRLGLDEHAVLLLHSRQDADTWRERLSLAGPALIVQSDGPQDPKARPRAGLMCVGAAAALLGVILRDGLLAAVDEELAQRSSDERAESRGAALAGYEAMAQQVGRVRPRAPASQDPPSPDWIELAADTADVAAPAIYAAATSVQVRTGLWRTMRPVIDHARCHRCHFMCALQCPDSAIAVDAEGYPRIDLDHCKGCLICVAQCPFHIIAAVPEHTAAREAS